MTKKDILLRFIECPGIDDLEVIYDKEKGIYNYYLIDAYDCSNKIFIGSYEENYIDDIEHELRSYEQDDDEIRYKYSYLTELAEYTLLGILIDEALSNIDGADITYALSESLNFPVFLGNKTITNIDQELCDALVESDGKISLKFKKLALEKAKREYTND